MGAGAYKFVKYENKTVYLEANENYYKGEPKIKNMQLRESADADFIPGVEQGTIDLADPSGSKSAFEQIKSINSNGELDGDRINKMCIRDRAYPPNKISKTVLKMQAFYTCFMKFCLALNSYK